MTSLVRDRRFSTYWFGQTVSQLGDRVSELAIPLIAVTTLQASPTAVGLLTAAIWLPNLLSLLVGAWVDVQPSKRRLLVLANVIQALAVLTLPVAFETGRLSLGQLYAVAIVLGAGGVLYNTAYPTFFAHLVEKDQYVEANSLLSTSRSGSFIVGPAVGGALIQAVTAPVAMLVDAVSFLVSAVTIGSVKVDEGPPRTEAPERLLRRAWSGLVFLRRHPYLRASLACATTLNFFSFVVAAVIILFASRTLGLSAGEIGLAFGIGAFGGLAGAVLAGRVARRIGTGATIAVGAVLFSAPMALIPLASGSTVAKVAVLAAAEFIGSVGVMLFDVNLNSLQTAVTPDSMRSRVSGAFSMVNYGIRPVGAVVGGVAAETFGITATIVVAAVGGTLSFLWLLGSPIITTRSVADLEPVNA